MVLSAIEIGLFCSLGEMLVSIPLEILVISRTSRKYRLETQQEGVAGVKRTQLCICMIFCITVSLFCPLSHLHKLTHTASISLTLILFHTLHASHYNSFSFLSLMLCLSLSDAASLSCRISLSHTCRISFSHAASLFLSLMPYLSDATSHSRLLCMSLSPSLRLSLAESHCVYFYLSEAASLSCNPNIPPTILM